MCLICVGCRLLFVNVCSCRLFLVRLLLLGVGCCWLLFVVGSCFTACCLSPCVVCRLLMFVVCLSGCGSLLLVADAFL